MEIIYFADNDGSNPAVTAQQISDQKTFIVQSFSTVNISVQLSARMIKNTTLNSAYIMVDCQPQMIGESMKYDESHENEIYFIKEIRSLLHFRNEIFAKVFRPPF